MIKSSQFWRNFDEDIVKPIFAVQLRINAALESIIKGAKIRHKKDTQNDEQSKVKFSQFSINQRLNNSKANNQDIEAAYYRPYLIYNRKQFNSTTNNVKYNKQIDQIIARIYPKELSFMTIYSKYVSPLILCWFVLINLLLYLIDLKNLESYKGVADCILPGRLIWTGSIAYKGRTYTSIMLLLYAILKINQYLKLEVIFLDCVEFAFMSEQEVIKNQFNCDQYNYSISDCSHIYEAFIKYDSDKKHNNIEYNSTLHIRLTAAKIMPKLNRDLTCKFVLKLFIRFMMILTIFFTVTITLVVGIYAFMFSLTLEGEYLAYPDCTKWRLSSLTNNVNLSQFDYTNSDISGYRVILKPIKLDDPIMIYHAISNVFFDCWFISEIVMFGCGYITIVSLLPIDTVIYCLRLKRELQSLIYRANNVSLRKDKVTKFLSVSIYLQLYAYFEQIKRYNVMIRRLILVVMYLNLVINSLSFGATLLKGEFLDDKEVYFVSAEIVFATVIVFTFLEIVRKPSYEMYALISTLCVDCIDDETRQKYSSLLSFYYSPAFCFSMADTELSLFFLIKNASYIFSVVAFIYNIFITRNYSIYVKSLPKQKIDQNS